MKFYRVLLNNVVLLTSALIRKYIQMFPTFSLEMKFLAIKCSASQYETMDINQTRGNPKK